MGYMRHHAIIVTSWSEEVAALARRTALECFVGGVAPVSEILRSPVNDYSTFMVAPDGSKEGWDHSDAGDSARDRFVAWLEMQRYEDGSSRLAWVEVQYGDETGDTRIVRDSDERWRAPRG